jgi:hypothetical protein
MRGHTDLIRLRESGVKPSGLVYLDDYPVFDKWVRWLEGKTMTTVCTHGDEVGSLDLRFVVGLRVNVTGDNVSRVKALAAACKKAGADVVFAMCGDKAAMWKKGDAKWLSF